MEGRYPGVCQAEQRARSRYTLKHTRLSMCIFLTAANLSCSIGQGFPRTTFKCTSSFYNTKAQTSARTHPGVVATQVFLLSDPNLYHASDAHSKISLTTPISYYDRLRIRQPGDARFALGPHVDGGSLERWEDAGLCRRKPN